MKSYLVYHPKRKKIKIGEKLVYCDPIENANQDPYVWNSPFLHSFCHITQMSIDVGDMCFWVNLDHNQRKLRLFCDLVFIVEEKIKWKTANSISRKDVRSDSNAAWEDHYSYAQNLRLGQPHYFKKRKRFTLKADEIRSFQPQNADGSLIDIADILRPDFSEENLFNHGKKPLRIDKCAEELYKKLSKISAKQLRGDELMCLRQDKRYESYFKTIDSKCGCQQ